MLGLVAMMAAAQAGEDAKTRDVAELVRILDGHKTPLVIAAGQPPVPGVFSTQGFKPTGDCQARAFLTVPAFKTPAYTNPEEIVAGIAMDFRTMTRWTVRDTAVDVAPSNPRFRTLRTASAANAARVKVLLDRLALACGNSVPQPDPVDTGAVSDRIAIRQGRDWRTCKFRRLPELSLTEQKPYPRYAFFSYDRGQEYQPELLIVERDDHIYDANEDSSYVQWGALRVVPRFSLENDDLRPTQMVRADVAVDGVPLRANWQVQHNKAQYGSGPFTSFVKVELSRYATAKGGREHGRVAAAMAAGRSVTLTLYDAAGQARQYVFDVTRLRDVPRALEGAQFKCG